MSNECEASDSSPRIIFAGASTRVFPCTRAILRLSSAPVHLRLDFYLSRVSRVAQTHEYDAYITRGLIVATHTHAWPRENRQVANVAIE